MFGRRVPPHIVYLGSLLLAALCLVGAFFAWQAHSWLWLGVALLFAGWFAVDAYRSYFWNQNKQRQAAENLAKNHPDLKR